MLDQATNRAGVLSRERSLLEFYADAFGPKASSPEAFRQHVVEWFFAAKHLRRFEVTHLTENPLPADLAVHRRLCDSLVLFGEFASKFAQNENIDLSPLGISIKSIQAETSLLKDRVAMFHEAGVSPEEGERLLKQLSP